MTKLVKNRDGNFTHVKNDIFESGLSAKAMGLFMYMWHLPDDWKFYEDELVNHFKDGKASIRSGIKELEEHGFLKRVQSKDEKSGKFKSFDWQLNESPLCDFPKAEKPTADNPPSENRTLLSTNNTKYESNKVLNKSLSISPKVDKSRVREKTKSKPQSKLQKSIAKWSEQIDPDVANYGYQLAKENAASKASELSYFNAVMRDWQDKGLSSVDDVKRYLDSKHSVNRSEHHASRQIPAWMSEKYDPNEDKLSPEKKAEMAKKMAALKEGSSA